MTYEPSPVPDQETPLRHSVRVPLARPIVTNVLLGIIVLVYLAESFLSRSLMDTDINVLVNMGAQVNFLVAMGGYWRLLASIFLHIGLMHILFNGWALYSLGREVEALYGSVRFTVVYFLSGLFGGLAFYLLGAPNVPSAGASGAIFGIIGAEIAFFLRNRRVFGSLSRQQLGNLLALVAINLVFGFTLAGINNMAHLGGLAGGLLLGLGLAPHYTVRWEGLVPTPRLVNRNPVAVQVIVALIAAIVLIGGIRLGDQRWTARLPGLLSSNRIIISTTRPVNDWPLHIGPA